MWLGRHRAGQRGPRRQKRGRAAWEAWSKRACGSELAWRLVRGASGVNGRRAGGVSRHWDGERGRSCGTRAVGVCRHSWAEAEKNVRTSVRSAQRSAGAGARWLGCRGGPGVRSVRERGSCGTRTRAEASSRSKR
jgi:hypothetical protein